MMPALFLLVAGIVTGSGQVGSKAVPLATLHECKAALAEHMAGIGPLAQEGEQFRPARFGICVPIETAGKDT
jgi:hypothetical protein